MPRGGFRFIRKCRGVSLLASRRDGTVFAAVHPPLKLQNASLSPLRPASERPGFSQYPLLLVVAQHYMRSCRAGDRTGSWGPYSFSA